MLSLYRNIRNRRIELGLSQSELAKKMGYKDKTMISHIENGHVDLPASRIMAFAKALDIDPIELFGLDGLVEEGERDG